MLEQILIKTALSKEALLSLFDSDCPRYSQKVLQDLTASGYVRVRNEVYESRNKKKTVRYYFITPEGVRFLIRTAKEDQDRSDDKRKTSLPWLTFINEEDTKGMAVFGDIRQERERIFSVAEAALVSEMAGADIPIFLHDVYSPIREVSQYGEMSTPEAICEEMEMETHSLTAEQLAWREMEKKRETARRNNTEIRTAKTAQELITDAMLKWMKAVDGNNRTYRNIMDEFAYFNCGIVDACQTDDCNYFRFVNPGTVKLVALLNNTGEFQDKHDTDRGRYAGLLQSRTTTLLLYPAHRPELVWSQQYSKAEEVAFKRWHSKLLPEFRESTGAVCGTILIQSAAKWKKLWRDPLPELKMNRELGNRFDHLYLTEISPAGERNLRDIMLIPHDDYIRGTVEQALEPSFSEELGYTFEKNDRFASWIFPLRIRMEDETTYFAVGTRIDIRQIIQIRSLASREQSIFSYGIICLPWQKEYYKAMLPHARLYWKWKSIGEVWTEDFEG